MKQFMTAGLVVASLALAGCGEKKTTTNPGTETQVVKEEAWGKHDGKDVKLYTLTNDKGMVCKITNYGATVTHLMAPDKNGKMDDIVIGFDTFAGYTSGMSQYFGCIAGRCANRIAGGKFSINGKEYTLATNNGPNHLHGGEKGFDKVVWDGKSASSPDGPYVELTYISKDGEEGYPGTVTATVKYTLTDKNELKVEMSATTDADTVVNLAHHTYWNPPTTR